MSVFCLIYKIFKAAFFSVISFINTAVSVIFISVLIAEVQRRVLRKILKENDSIQSSNDIRKNVFYLKRFAELISMDRKRIEGIILQKQNFQIHALEEQELIQPFIQETFYTSIQQKTMDQNEKTDKIMKTLDAVKNDFSICKNQLQNLFSDNALQMSNSGIIASIVEEFKEDFTTLLIRNKSSEKKMLQTISNFLNHSQVDIRNEMKLFSSIVDNSETYDNDNFKLTLEATLNQMETLKKNLISAHTFTTQQGLKMENLQESVVRFNQKFMYFAVNFDKFLKQSKVAKSNICRKLQEAEIVFTSSTEKLDVNARILLQQAQIFSVVLTDLKNVLGINKPNFSGLALPMSEREGRLIRLTNVTDTTWIDNVDTLNRKLENLLHMEENSGEKLESLKRTSTNFENFHNLMKSITRGYNTLLRFFLSTLESSQKFYCDPRMKLKQQTAPGDISEKDFVPFDDCKQWGDFPSESFITDESSEFLVHSSDESIDRPSEISLIE